MGVMALDERKYGRLLSKTLPKVIESGEEFDRAVDQLEELDMSRRELTPERNALRSLLAKLIADYDAALHPIPRSSPHETLAFLMEQRGLKQRDLLPVFGSRGIASEVANGKRSVSKAQAKRLAELFGVSADLFI